MKLSNKLFTAATLILPLALSTEVSAKNDVPHFKPLSLITVTGQSRMEVDPDQVTINFRAQFSASKQDEANKGLSAEFSKITDYLLKELKLDKSKVIAETLSVYPVYKYEENKEPQLVKYTACRNLAVTLTDFTKLDQVISNTLKSSVFTLNNTVYSLQNPSVYAAKARKLAAEDSLEKAKDLAGAYKAKIVKVHKIDYNQNYQMVNVTQFNASPRLMANSAKMMAGGAPEPSYFNPQKIELNDEVKVQFIIKAEKLNQ